MKLKLAGTHPTAVSSHPLLAELPAWSHDTYSLESTTPPRYHHCRSPPPKLGWAVPRVARGPSHCAVPSPSGGGGWIEAQIQGVAQCPSWARKRTLVPWVPSSNVVHKTFFLKQFSQKTLLVSWEPLKSLPPERLLWQSSLCGSNPCPAQPQLAHQHPSSPQYPEASRNYSTGPVSVPQISHHNMRDLSNPGLGAL